MKRAVVCIGVDHAGNMPPLRAAASGAADFATWASTQQCDTKLLSDARGSAVTLRDISKAIRQYVDAGTYGQLIIYFSGHGILKAPDTEYWLLSDAPEDPNEAVNLAGSIANARSSGIPHVVFVSDACRSGADTPQLRAVTGGVIFPSKVSPPPRPEIDTFYATQPGDPAYEVPAAQSTAKYKGIFTQYLLDAVKAPTPGIIETVDDGTTRISIIPSWKLKPLLEASVPVEAATIDVKLRQSPELRVESHAPKFFAVIAGTLPPTPAALPPGSPVEVEQAFADDIGMEVETLRGERDAGISREIEAAAAELDRDTQTQTLGSVFRQLGARHFRQEAVELAASASSIASASGITNEVQRLANTRGRDHFETTTGFSIHGGSLARAYASAWSLGVFADPSDAAVTHIRLSEKPGAGGGDSLLLEFTSGVGTVVAILPGFVGSVVMDDRRLLTVNYVPSNQTGRYQEYLQNSDQLEQMKAFAAVAARSGRFVVENEKADALAQRLRQLKGFDPTLGIYAAYAYAQVGQFEDAVSVFQYMRDDSIPVPFDVAMLASRCDPNFLQGYPPRLAPFCPMLSQGWALLMKGDPLFKPVHAQLQAHLVPSLWTCLDEAGVGLALTALEGGEVR